MKNWLLCVMLLLGTVLLFGQGADKTFSTCLFLGLEPSSINLAIGGHDVGNVNIWHHSPLTSYTNPAMGAFHEGVGYGFTKFEWLKDADLGILYHASMVNLGYQGWSITLPSYKFRDQSAIYFDTGTHNWTDFNGEENGTFHTYDSAGVYGLAVNIFEVADKYIPEPFIKEHLDLAVGLNYVDIQSYLGPVYYGPGAIGTVRGRSHCWNLGTVGRFRTEHDLGIGFEGVVAHTNQNLFNNELGYGIIGGDPEKIWGRTNTGFALGVNLKTANEIIGDIGRKFPFCDNLLSARYLSSFSDDSEYKTKGYGMELGLLDTFYIRKGRYEDFKGEVYGDTFGYGINLHYKDLVSLSWNYAEYPGGGLTDVQESDDINVNLDLLTITKELHNLLN